MYPRSFLMSLVISSLLAATVSAQAVAVLRIPAGSDGTHYYTIKIQGGKVTAFERITNVVTVDGTPPTDSPPPTDPDEDAAARWKQWALTAQQDPNWETSVPAVALVYQFVIDTKAIPPDHMPPFIKQGMEAGLSSESLPHWQAFRDQVVEYLTARAREGELETREDYEGYYTDIVAGLNAASDAALPPFFREILLKLLFELLQRFLDQIGN